MQRLFLFSLIFLLHTISQAAEEAKPLTFNSSQEKLSYSLGISFAPKVAQSLKQQDIKIDPALFAQGLQDMLSGHPLALSEEELKYTLDSLQHALEEKQLNAITQKAKQNYEQLFTKLGYPEQGNPEAHITVVSFFDYQCPHCKNMHPEMLRLLKRYPDAKIIYRDLPILGPASLEASELALAAHQLGQYQELHDAFMAAGGPLTSVKLKSIVEEAGLNWSTLQSLRSAYPVQRILKNNANMAASLGIATTPSYLFTRTVPGKKKATADIYYLSGKQHILTFERRFETL